jgi:UDP-glucose 4-epimerase
MTRNTRLMMGFRPERGLWASPGSGICLITGGAGFIGSHLAERLVRDGYRVRILDDLSTGRPESLAAVGDRVDFITGDVRVLSTCVSACRGVSVVFHLAASVLRLLSLEDPFTVNEVNVSGTLNMLEGARRNGVHRFVFASSSSVYGDSPVLPKAESTPEDPRSPYAASKLAAEKYCLAYNACHRLSTVILRYFNVYGPRQDPSSPYAAVIPSFLEAIGRGEAPLIHGDGRQTRDFTYVDDVVEANLLAAWSSDCGGETFNIAAGSRYSILNVAELVGSLTGHTRKPRFTEPRPLDIRDSQASIQKARRILGFRPLVSLEEGLGRMLAESRRLASDAQAG